MKTVLLIIISYIIGFFTAIPIGATQVEIAKRSISGYFREALMVVVGSVASDLMYGFVAMFGIAPFLKDEKMEAFFWFIGGLILIVLAVFTLVYSNNGDDNAQKVMLFKSHASLAIGFSLAVTNPPIIFWWLFCFEFIKSIGILPGFASEYTVIFLLSAGLGIASYLTSLALFLKKVGKNISSAMEYKINRIMGFLLIALSLYFLFKSAAVFLKFFV